MTTNTKTLEIFSNPHAAEIMRTRLDAAGILAVVSGADVATMLSNMGTAFANVRVEVAPEDYERARSVLEEDRRRREQLTDWQCVRCDEHNDASFELCWNCDKQRDEFAAFPPSEKNEIDKDHVEPDPIVAVPIDTSSRPKPNPNPYAPTWDSDHQRSAQSMRSLIAVIIAVACLAAGFLVFAILRS